MQDAMADYAPRLVCRKSPHYLERRFGSKNGFAIQATHPVLLAAAE